MFVLCLLTNKSITELPMNPGLEYKMSKINQEGDPDHQYYMRDW